MNRVPCVWCSHPLIIVGPMPEVAECERCAEETAAIAEANRQFDEEEARKADERFQFIADTLRELYPTHIPAEWTR